MIFHLYVEMDKIEMIVGEKTQEAWLWDTTVSCLSVTLGRACPSSGICFLTRKALGCPPSPRPARDPYHHWEGNLGLEQTKGWTNMDAISYLLLTRLS